MNKSEVWGSRWLSPDISAFGVLKDEHAVLFVEYDGSFRHSDVQGQERDQRKTTALLGHAPRSSCVLRIGHVKRDLSMAENATHAVVDVWRAGHEPSLMKVVQQTIWALLLRFEHLLQEDVFERLSRFEITQTKQDFLKASTFAREAVLTRNFETKRCRMQEFLEWELQFSTSEIEALACKFPAIWGVNIDSRLRPAVAWLEDVGLSRKQVVKVVAGFPAVLGCSIECNLKPTVAWLEDVGLSREQVAKVVACCPRVLSLSVEANLKPTVAWLEDVGLSRQQVAKVVGGSPWVLGSSIEAKLKRTVAWLEDVGLSREELARVVACFPQVLGCSIENNLSQKLLLLQQFFCDERIRAMIVYCPPMLGYKYSRLVIRLKVLQEHDCLSKLGCLIVLTDAAFYRRFPP